MMARFIAEASQQPAANQLQLDWTTQAIGQQNTSALRAGCEARRREIVVIFGCSQN